MKINYTIFKTKLAKILYIAISWVLASLYFSFLIYLLFLPYFEQLNLSMGPFFIINIINSLGALFAGLILGSFEMFYFKDRFRKKPFIYTIIIKTVFYLVSMLIFFFIFSILYNILFRELSIFDPLLFKLTFDYLTGSSTLVLFTIYGAILLITQFFIQVSDRFGPGVLLNFLLGRYHSPKEEKRVFMFLDLKSSTTIAEKVGHVKYFNLLNDFFYDITDSIIYSGGEIYQYVGDEVVISWKLRKGIENANCLKCFFNIEDVIRENSEFYQNKYGLVPVFKAGLHCGKVTTGEIGIVKKEIIFSGDVLNTASRIQEICNKYEKKILISGKLLNMLQIEDKYKAIEIDELKLKGKAKPIKLFGIEKIK